MHIYSRNRQLKRVIFVSIVLFFVSSCGQRGPLNLPEEKEAPKTESQQKN